MTRQNKKKYARRTSIVPLNDDEDADDAGMLTIMIGKT